MLKNDSFIKNLKDKHSSSYRSNDVSNLFYLITIKLIKYVTIETFIFKHSLLKFTVMSTLRNKVQLIGHLGANPEVKSLSNGSKKASMRIATTERYQSNGEWKEETQWHHVALWDRAAERAEQQLQKGNFVLLEGKLVHRTYATPDGEQKYITEVQVHNFIRLERKQGEPAAIGNSTNDAEVEESGLPF